MTINTVEEAINICQENHLIIKFEMNLYERHKGNYNSDYVLLIVSAWQDYKAKTLVEVVNLYLKDFSYIYE